MIRKKLPGIHIEIKDRYVSVERPKTIIKTTPTVSRRSVCARFRVRVTFDVRQFTGVSRPRRIPENRIGRRRRNNISMRLRRRGTVGECRRDSVRNAVSENDDLIAAVWRADER